MLDKIEQAELANFLKSVMFIERDTEAAKIELALRPDFNLVDAFKIFDMKSLGGISKQDLMDGLRLNLDFADY